MIVRALIRDPRVSDNAVARQCSLPVKTVGRRRKRLEELGLIAYMTRFEHFYRNGGHGAVELFILKMRQGITKYAVAKRGILDQYNDTATKHIRSSQIAERDGRVHLIIMLESWKQEDLGEIINADIIPFFERQFGAGAIEDITGFPIHSTIRMLHNYLPGINMDKGVIANSWENGRLFVR